MDSSEEISEAEFQRLAQTIATSIQKILQNGEYKIKLFRTRKPISCPQCRRCNVWLTSLTPLKIHQTWRNNCKYFAITHSHFQSILLFSFFRSFPLDIRLWRTHINSLVTRITCLGTWTSAKIVIWRYKGIAWSMNSHQLSQLSR